MFCIVVDESHFVSSKMTLLQAAAKPIKGIETLVEFSKQDSFCLS